MSSSTENWELGVVAFYDSFENYDRFTKIGQQYLGKDNPSSWGERVQLDTGISSDYRESPFYLTGRLGKKTSGGISTDYVPGSEIILGPSTNEDYSGSVERASIYFSGNYTRPYFSKNMQRTFLAYPSSTYEVGDQVIIRTVPRGWLARGAGGVFSASHYGVCPVRRYDQRQDVIQLASEAFPGLENYDYESMKAVRLYTNRDTTGGFDYAQFIKAYGDINSFSPEIRRWRISYYYRLGRYLSGYEAPSSIDAAIRVGLMSGDGEWIEQETTMPNYAAEQGSYDTSGLMRSRFGFTTTTSDWTYQEKLTSPFISDGNDWDFNSSSGINFSAANRANRWGVEIGLYCGVNTAFDVDDFVIEHASGTSREAYGYYEIQDFPDPDTISAEPIEIWKRNRLANGSLRQITTDTNERPKFIVSAEFRDVDVSIYNDMKILEKWSKLGRLISLRPKIRGLPQVMAGVLRVRKRPSSHWSLNMATFTLEFEEA